jgi:iron complex outermembrane receptor protein
MIALAVAGDASAQMEEVLVTARKREENLQKVPVAVNAFSSEEIQRLAINDLNDLGKYTASVIFDTGFAPQDTRVVIRGLSPVRGRQNVAILQDGVDISSQSITTNGGSLLINPRYFDVERIEVVKGPQNALYGRSAFNGAINYVMRKPSEEFNARAFTDIGQNGQAEFRGSVGGPIIGKTLLGDISAAVWNFDGFYDNSVTGSGVGGQEGQAFSGSLVWNASEKLSVRLRGEYLDDEYEPLPYRQLLQDQRRLLPEASVTPPAPGQLPIFNPNINLPPRNGIRGTYGTLPSADSVTVALSENPRTGQDYPGTRREVTRFTLSGDYDLGPATLTYLGHVASAETREFSDGFSDGSVSLNFVGAERRLDGDTDLQSHELRLSSNGDGPVSWTVGGLYWHEEADALEGSFNCINILFGPPPYPPCADVVAAVGTDASPLNPDPWARETTHWSAYGLVDWEVVNGLNLIFEGRYTDEELDSSGPRRDGTSRIIGVPGNAFFGPQTIPAADGILDAPVSDSFFSPKVTAQWSPNDDMMFYASWAQTYKPAGVALLTGGAGGFDPAGQTFETEEMQVWEVGGKTQWLDDRLIFNAALFFQDYTDKQVSVQRVDPVSGLLVPRTENASAAEVLGFEADINWAATDWLQLRASYTFLDSEYSDFVEITAGAANVAQGGNCVPDNSLGPFQCRIDLSGNELEFAPRHAAVGGFTLQSRLVGETDWFIDGNVIYQGERFSDRFNSVGLDSYTVADFRFGVRGSNWEVLAYLENAFDDDTIKNALGGANTAALEFVGPPFDGLPTTFVFPPSQILIMPDRRQFGIRASYRFGGE